MHITHTQAWLRLLRAAPGLVAGRLPMLGPLQRPARTKGRAWLATLSREMHRWRATMDRMYAEVAGHVDPARCLISLPEGVGLEMVKGSATSAASDR